MHVLGSHIRRVRKETQHNQGKPCQCGAELGFAHLSIVLIAMPMTCLRGRLEPDHKLGSCQERSYVVVCVRRVWHLPSGNGAILRIMFVRRAGHRWTGGCPGTIYTTRSDTAQDPQHARRLEKSALPRLW
jgi:hypothetical protein